jgi:hypothetical protein
VYYSLEFFDRPCYSNSAISCTSTFDQVDDGSWVELTDYTKVANRLDTSFIHTAPGSSFSANKDFAYRVKAMNGVGMGVPSATLLVLTDDIPKKMNYPTLDEIGCNFVKLSWVG